MNFARAARGTLTRDGMLRQVNSQSEIELGRHLDASERAVLLSRVPIDAIVRCIDKVCYWLNNPNYIHFTICSMVLVRSSFCSSFVRDLN